MVVKIVLIFESGMDKAVTSLEKKLSNTTTDETKGLRILPYFTKINQKLNYFSIVTRNHDQNHGVVKQSHS